MYVVIMQGDPFLRPALSEHEFRMASGTFDPQKYEEYNRQVRVGTHAKVAYARGTHARDKGARVTGRIRCCAKSVEIERQVCYGPKCAEWI